MDAILCSNVCCIPRLNRRAVLGRPQAQEYKAVSCSPLRRHNPQHGLHIWVVGIRVAELRTA